MADEGGGDKKEEEKKEDAKKEGEGDAEGEPPADNQQDKHKMLIDTVKIIDKIILSGDDEKLEYDKFRRWKILIKDIYLTPSPGSEIFDGFIQFTLGGNYRVYIN